MNERERPYVAALGHAVDNFILVIMLVDCRATKTVLVDSIQECALRLKCDLPLDGEDRCI